MEFRVFYEGPLSHKEVTVDYSTQSGTAAAGVDYTATFGTLTFADGETEDVISVPISQDPIAEYDETFSLMLSNPGNALLEDGAQSVAALATIEDDEPRVSIAPAAAEVTEGETAVFNLTRTGDTSAELLVWMSFRERRPGSAYSGIWHLNDTFQPGESTLQVSLDTPDDDLDTPNFPLFAFVRTPSEFQRPNYYLPGVYQTTVTVLDNDLPTVTIEAAEDRRVENEDAEFTLSRRGDLTDPLTVNLAVTQEGDYLDGTPPSTVTFAAGDSETTLTVAVDNDNLAEVHGSVTVAISSGDYITGNPGSATVEIADDDRAHTTVLSIAGNGPVTEGEDVVFTITRTGGIQLDLEVPVTLTHVWHSDGQPEYSDLELERRQFSEETVEASFEPGDTAATLTVATENENLNDGNSFFKASIALSFDYGIDPDSQLAAVWVRDDDIPTVTVTPATQVHFELDPDDFEDPSTRDLAPKYTLHRTGDTSTFLRVDLRSPWVKHYTWGIDPSPSYNNPDYQDSRPILRDESSHEWLILVTRVPPLGAEGWVYLRPRFCPDTTDERCGTRPQYLVGEESTHYTKIYSNFMAVSLEAGQSSVVEGQPATFTLNRYGGNPENKWNPLTVRVEVTQDGEYIKGLPPQTVTFRGYPETTTEDAEQTTTLSIPTDDDMVDEAHGAVTVRILPPVDLSSTDLSYIIESNAAGFESQSVTVQVTDNDYDPPPMSISDARAGEADGSMEFFVTVAPSEREMTVEWETASGTGVGGATQNTDYERASGKLTFAIGETTKTINVEVLDDDLNETDETFTVNLNRPNNATYGRSTGTGTIEDDDEGTVVTIHPMSTYGGTEEGDPAEFILHRVGGTAEINVELTLSQEGDFLTSTQSTTITKSIPLGAMETTLQVPTEDDSTVEANGSVTVTLKPHNASDNLSSYTVGDPDDATVQMRDNDRTLSIQDVEAGEGDGSMTFTITLSAAAADPVRVEAFTQPGAATSRPTITETSLGRDFRPRTEFLNFQPGETEKSFTVTLVDDDIDEPSEDFTVKLSRPSSNVWLTDASATGTIVDNDDPMEARISRQANRVDENRGSAVQFAVQLFHDDTGGSERDTKLFWQVTAGTATEGEDYTKPYSQQRGTLDIPIGHLTATIEVALIDDDLLEQELETFTVELVEGQRLELPDNESDKKVEISIRDDERLTAAITPREDSVVEGDSAVFEVRLSGGITTEDTGLEYTVAGTAVSGDDYTASGDTLTIPAGDDTGAITIRVLEDSTLDPGETVEVTLTSGASGGRDASIPDPTATVTIIETGTLTVSVAPAEGEEGGTLSFAVTLSLASQDDVTVDWRTADDPGAESAATAGVDYTAASGTLTVPAGLTSAVITVETLDDTLAAEGAETFRLDLVRAQTGQDAEALPLGVSTAVGTISDNDIAPTGMTLAAAPDQLSEDAGATAITVTATLNGQRLLARDTQVQLALEDGSAAAGEDFQTATARLTIPAGQMSAAATLTLTPVNDAVQEGDETASIIGGADGLTVTPAQFTITDDDSSPTGVTLTLDPDAVGEGAGETDLTVTATLTGGDLRAVDTQVRLSVEGVSLTLEGGGATTAATADDFATDAVTLTIPARQTGGSATLAFTPVDDTLSEGNETAQVTGASEGLTVTPAELTIEDNDREPTRIALSASPLEVVEGDGDTILTVTATLEGGGSRTSSTDVSLAVEGLTATAGGDFTAQEGVTLTIPAGQLNHTADLTLTPVDDDVAEGTEQLAVHGSNTEPGLPVSRVRVNLTDNDAQPMAITLSLDRNTVAENGGAQRLTVTAVLEGDSRRTVDTSVRLRLVGQTAGESDYSALTGVLTIRAGESEGAATLVLVPRDDYIDEDDETLEVTGSTAESRTGPALEVSGVVVTITDDDTAGVTVTPTELFVVEGGSGNYRVSLATQPSDDVTVTVAGHAGTNITLSGDTLTDDVLTFTPDNWISAQTVRVTAVQDDDATASPDVTLTHTVSGTGEYAGVTAADVVVSITEDDEPGVTVLESALEIDEGGSGSYTVVLDTKPTDDVTVAVSGHADTDITLSGATLTNDTLTFTSDTWGTAQTVTVTAAQDDDAASDAAVTLTHTANGGGYVAVQETVTVTIVEKDTAVLSVEAAEAAEDAGNVVFTVSISAAAGEEVTVDYATSGGTATAGQDYTETTGALTFAANSVASQTISVPVTDDTVDEEEEETFTLTLSNVQGASLAGGESTLAVTGTITDDDDPAVTASFGQSAYSVDEGGTVEVTVTLSADPEREVTVQLTHDPQGNTSSADYSGVPENLVFQKGDTEKSFTFSATADDIDDDGESVALGFGTMPDRVTAGATATVTITDDDAAGVTVSKTALSIDEGGSDTYTVVLDTEPTASVTVAIAGHAGTDISLDKTSLTFTASTWDTAQTVTVTAGEDNDAASDAAVTLTHTANGGGYVAVQETVTVTITEDDTASPSLDLSLPVPTNNDADDSGDVTLNDVLTYTATATNDGNVPLSGVTLSDLLVDEDGHVCGSLDIGEQCQLTGTHTVVQTDVDAGVVANTVTAEATELTTAVTASQQTPVAQESTLTLTKTTTATSFTSVGDTISYGYEVTNGGTVTLSGTLAISDDKIGSSDITCGAVPDGGLAPSASVTCSGTYTVVQADLDAGGVTNKASASLDGATSSEATATVPWKAPQAFTEPQLSIAPAVQVAEDAGTAEVAVTLTESSLQTVTVEYATSDGTAISGADYVAASATLTFAPGETEKKIQVTITDDEVDEEEEDETFTVTLSSPNNASLDASSGTVTITDDDDPAVTASFGQSAYSVDEGSTVEVTVTLSADPEREVTVQLSHDPQGNTSSADYSGVPENLVFQKGDTEKSFTFSATADEVDDDGESVALGFGTMPDGVTAGATATVTVTITDDDQRGVTIAPTSFTVLAGQSNKYSVVLKSQPTGDVTVTVNGQSGTDLTVSPVSLTFTASNWNTAREVTVAADNNASRASVTLTHTANGGDYVDVQETVTVTIVGQPQDLVIQVGLTASQQEMAVIEGGSNTYSLVLSSVPTGDVTISVNVPTGNDLAASPDSLTFTSENWDTMQTVTVSAAEDDDAIVDDAVDIGHTVSGLGDAEIPGVRVTIIENDTPDVTVAPTELTIGEGGTGQYTVVLDTLPSDNVTVNIAVPSGTDLSVSPSGPLTFTAATWSQAQVVTVTAEEDDDADTDPAVTLTHTVTGGDYEGENAAGVTVSITENDHSVSFSASDYTATEGGDDAQVTVLLNAPAPSSIDIPLTAEGMNGATSDDWSGVPEEVTFNTGDTSRTFTVTATDDDVEDNNEMVALGFGDLPDSVVRGTPDRATVTLMNDDGNGPGTEPLTIAMTCGPDNTWSGEITQPGQMDHWYWHLDGNDKYSGPADHGIVGYAVNMMGVGSGEGTLQDPHIFRIQGLYDGTPLSPLGGTIPSWWGNDRGKGWDSLVSHDIQHTGVYEATVGANPFGEAANGTGTYKICVMGPGPFRLEEPPERRLVVQPDLYMTGGDRDTYTVGLSAAPEEIATVWVDPVFNSTSEHFSVTPKRMIFTADDWDTPQVVTITRKASAPAYIDDSGFLIGHDTSGYEYFGASIMAYFHTWKSSVYDHLERRKPLSERNNSPSMGEPDISGTAQVGQTLTATTADILDLDGLTGVVYEYQWYRHDFATGLEDPIEGATGSSYTLTAADACMGIVVGVIFTDDAGYRQGLSSFPVPVPPQGQADCANNPAMGEPDISGTAQVGETLTAGTYGIWDVDGMIGVDFAYRWVRHDFDAAADTSIAGATGTSYTLTPDDEGKGIKVQVSFTDDAGNEESLTSASTTAVAAAPPPPPDNVRAVTKKSGAVELTWDAPDGATVTGYRIERRRADEDRSGPQRSHGQPRDHHTLVEDTGSADTGYTDKSAEKGLEYEYRVSARNESGAGEESDWVRVGPASASNNPATGLPTISGTAQVGETLTADITGIADADGLNGESFTYQWVSGDGTTDTDIENATGSTYTLVAADQGRSVKVRVTFTDDGGNEETLTSAPTAPVWGDGLPGAPRNLTATPGNKEVTLSWDPPADNGNAPATRYRIEWRVDGKDYDKNHWGTARSTSYTTTDQANLANGVKYFFRVKAENGSGNSYGPYGPASGEVSATPTSGSAVDLGTPVLSDTENLHHGMVRLDWEDIEDAGWYVVQYYHLEGGEWLDLPAAGVEITFHGSSAVVSNLHGLSWLRVGAASCDGASEWSQIEELYGTNASDWEGVPVPEVEEGDEIEPCPVVLGTPVLSEPEYLHHGMVQLDWQDIEDAGWYVVQYYHLEDGEWLDLPAEGVEIEFHGSSAVVSNLHGLSWLRVGAASCDGASEWSQIEELYGTKESDWEGVPVPEVAEGDEIEPCPEDADTSDNNPATGAPTISGTAQVEEMLTADTSGIADADGFTNAAFTYQWLADDVDISGATGSTYTLTDSDEGKAVKIEVSFTDDAGHDETLTSAATDAVAAEPSEPPDKPRGLEATASHGQVVLTWDDPQDESITGYVILRRVRVNDQGGDFSELVADTGTAATTYTDDTVAASTTYTYRIKAINGAGTSERSRWVHIDTPAAP